MFQEPNMKKTDQKISDVDKKIPDVIALVKETNLDVKVTEMEGKIPNIIGLATNSALTAVENKIPDVSSLVTKTEFDAKLKGISDRVTSNKSKHLLVENELKKLKKIDLSSFRRKNYFGNNNINYLVFEVSLQYLNFYDDSFSKPVLSWNSKAVFKGIIKAPRSNNNILSPTTENTFDPQKIKLKFNGSCLVQDQITYTSRTIVNIYIVYEIAKKNSISS